MPPAVRERRTAPLQFLHPHSADDVTLLLACAVEAVCVGVIVAEKLRLASIMTLCGVQYTQRRVASKGWAFEVGGCCYLKHSKADMRDLDIAAFPEGLSRAQDRS